MPMLASATLIKSVISHSFEDGLASLNRVQDKENWQYYTPIERNGNPTASPNCDVASDGLPMSEKRYSFTSRLGKPPNSPPSLSPPSCIFIYHRTTMMFAFPSAIS